MESGGILGLDLEFTEGDVCGLEWIRVADLVSIHCHAVFVEEYDSDVLFCLIGEIASALIFVVDVFILDASSFWASTLEHFKGSAVDLLVCRLEFGVVYRAKGIVELAVCPEVFDFCFASSEEGKAECEDGESDLAH